MHVYSWQLKHVYCWQLKQSRECCNRQFARLSIATLFQCNPAALQVVRDEGSVLSCALNATCAALVDAGVLLHNMFGEQTSLYNSSV